MGQSCAASSPSTTPMAPTATWACAMIQKTLTVVAVLAALLPPNTGAMYLRADPEPSSDAIRKCIDGHAVALMPEAQAMTSGLATTVTPNTVETTESPPPASTTQDSLEAATTLLPPVPEVAASSAAPPPVATPSMTYAAHDAVADAIREEGRSIEQQRREVEDSLNELFTRASSRFGRYAAGFPQVQARSLFNRRMSLVPPPPPPPLPYEMPPEVSKDVYIHLAADERAPTMPAPPSLPPRKHYKIIVIKPPTPSPPVETTTRRVDVETLIYVLVPKGEAPAPPTTTPRPPSKHEVFFIRYKAPVDNKTASVGRNTEAEPSFVLDTSTTTTTTKPPTMFPDYANLIDLRSSSSEISERNTPSDEDENELDGTVGDSDAINDLLSVSTDDIVRSWRRADGDIHFDADLKRIARSHSSHAESVSKDVSKGDAMDSAEDAVQEATSPPARCRQYATAEDLNAALDVGDEEGKRVQGAPDFDAVLQGKAHYGGNAEIAEICAEKSASEPFAIRNVLAPPAELEHLEDDSENQRRVDVTPKAKFSARYSSSLVF